MGDAAHEFRPQSVDARVPRNVPQEQKHPGRQDEEHQGKRPAVEPQVLPGARGHAELTLQARSQRAVDPRLIQRETDEAIGTLRAVEDRAVVQPIDLDVSRPWSIRGPELLLNLAGKLVAFKVW